mmetsp:Transcript_34102/g.79901  ORF Transcript_34102/g.79901 Transcript_34102/m.79901 type:complete len:271 (+) Transcript_34102:975-1787(+)
MRGDPGSPPQLLPQALRGPPHAPGRHRQGAHGRDRGHGPGELLLGPRGRRPKGTRAVGRARAARERQGGSHDQACADHGPTPRDHLVAAPPHVPGLPAEGGVVPVAPGGARGQGVGRRPAQEEGAHRVAVGGSRDRGAVRGRVRRLRLPHAAGAGEGRRGPAPHLRVHQAAAHHGAAGVGVEGEQSSLGDALQVQREVGSRRLRGRPRLQHADIPPPVRHRGPLRLRKVRPRPHRGPLPDARPRKGRRLPVRTQVPWDPQDAGGGVRYRV